MDGKEVEIYNIIKAKKWNKASGEDGKSVKILKKINRIIFLLIDKLINQAFYEGRYLNSLILAKVVQIFKSTSKASSGNFRPLSILSSLNKTIYNRLYIFY